MRRQHESNGTTANACYTPTGMPVAALPGGGCPHNDIANPYWNAAPQALVNTGQNFPTYDTFPGSLGLEPRKASARRTSERCW